MVALSQKSVEGLCRIFERRDQPTLGNAAWYVASAAASRSCVTGMLGGSMSPATTTGT